MCAEYIQEIGLESEPLLLHFLTLGIQQLTLFVCESWGFVIYNQFSALVSSVLFFFFAVCILPWRLSQHSSVVLVHSLSPSMPFASSLCLPPPPHPSLHLPFPHTLQRPVKCAPAVQAVGAVYHGTSSGSPGSTAQHTHGGSHNLCTSVLHMMLNIIDPLNKSTTQRALKQPFCLKSGKEWSTDLNMSCSWPVCTNKEILEKKNTAEWV